MEAGKESAKPGDRSRALRWWVIGLALVVGLIAWVATQGDDDGASEPTPATAEPRIVSEEELADIASSSGHPVYWVGPREGKELEVSESAEGNVQLSYVDEGAEPGGDRADLLTIGSYPLADPAGELDGFAEGEGAIVRRANDGRKVVTSLEAPSSVYFASPDGSVQVEVYDPLPERAMKLALSGQVEPID